MLFRSISFGNTTTGTEITRAWRNKFIEPESGAEEGEARIAGRLVDCFATTTGMPREIDDFNFWTLPGHL